MQASRKIKRRGAAGTRCPRLMAWAFIAFSLVGLVMSEPLSAADKTAFTEDVARRMVAAMPEAEVKVTGALALSITYPGRPEGEVHVIKLDRIWDFCSRNASDCPRVVSEFVENYAASSPRDLLSAQRERLMAVIRPTLYAQQVRRNYAQAGLDAVIGIVGGDLRVLCVLDAGGSTRMIHGKDLAELGLTKEEAFTLAATNVARLLPPIRESAVIAENGTFGSVGGDPYYGASRLLLHGEWRELTARFKGELVVAVADQDRIFFADSGDPGAVQKLKKAALDASRQSERPMSSVLLVWVPDGWREWPH